MKKFSKLFGIIAIVTIIGFSMTACDSGGGSSGGGGGGKGGSVSVGQLPSFPSGSTPAATRADAVKILAEFRESQVMFSVYGEAWDVIDANSPKDGNYSFSNRSLPGGSVRVTASSAGNETNTGGYKAYSDNRKAVRDLDDALDELYDAYPRDNAEIARLENELNHLREERSKIQFAVGNKASSTWNNKQKWETIQAITEGGVTIAKGSTVEGKGNYSENETVSAAGDIETFRYNGDVSSKSQEMTAFTVTSSSGSVKIILDRNFEWSSTSKNWWYWLDESDDIGTRTAKEKFSGSLKVYGSNNALLIDHQIVDWDSFNLADSIIFNDIPYTFDPATATPLTNNTKVNGIISSPGSVALYSIDVVNGTKYHLWWDSVNTSYPQHMDVRVRGYDSDGILFFDRYADWDSDWVNYYSFTAKSTGTVYIMVYPRDDEDDTGTFAIAYNTSGVLPFTSSSYIMPFSANLESKQNKTNSFEIPKKPAVMLEHLNNRR